MQRFILDENIRKFKKLLAAEQDEKARRTLVALVQTAQEQLARLKTDLLPADSGSEAARQPDSSAGNAVEQRDQGKAPKISQNGGPLVTS